MRYNTNSTHLGPVAQFLWGRLFPLPFLLAGAIILFFGLRSIDRAKASKGWPSVSGIVVSSEVDSSRGDKRTTYHAEVLYEYVVDGTKYLSNRIGYGDYGSSNPNHARMTVNRYPKNKKVVVFYMPEQPEESVLEAGINNSTYWMPAFGSVFFLAGLGMFIFLPRLLAKQAESDELDEPDVTSNGR